MKIVAAIDIGSYSLEMSVYELSSRKEIRRIDNLRHVADIGREIYLEGKISYETIDDICRVLSEYVKVMEGYQVSDCLVCATSALKESKNAQILLDQIKVRTSLNVRVLSNSEQHFLMYKAIALKETEFQEIIEKGTAIADINSGSVQLSLFDKGALVTTQYLHLGALRIRESLRSVKQTFDQTELSEILSEMIDNDIQTFKKLFLKDREIKNLVATGSCALYLHRMSNTFSREEFYQLYKTMQTLSPEAIQEEYDIPVEYAYLLLPSMLMLNKVLEITDAETVWAPGVLLTDGMIADYAESEKLFKFSHDFTEDILAASRNISKRYQCNKQHSQVLSENALKIFDSMKKYHGFGKRERLLLQLAAILHDCGKYISMRNPAECAYNIIMSTEIIGLSHKERKMVASIVKYNTLPYSYETETDVAVAKLTAILRLANAMDRSHKHKFQNAKMVLKDRQMIITTDSPEDITLERRSFVQKADFFEEVYGIRPVLKQKKGV